MKNKNNNHLEKNIAALFLKNPFAGYNYKQLSHTLGINDKVGRELVKKTIEKLLEKSFLLEAKRGKYKLNPHYVDEKLIKQLYIIGKVDMKQTGKAYVIPENKTEDIYIAPNNTNKALHGDIVKVLLFPKRKGRKTEGEIVEIISRSKKQFVGIIKISNDFGFLLPDNTNMTVGIFIPSNKLNNAKNGDKVIVNLIDWPEDSKNPFGEVIQVLGKPGNNEVEMSSILAEYNFPLSFTKETLIESEKINTDIPQEEIIKRKDFREITTFTIDPEDAKDFDDALSIKRISKDCWEVGIHIADVTYYFKANSAINKEAYERGTSVYLVDRVVPMLPEKISNEVCSLRPYENKLCFSVVLEIDENAKVLKEWIGKTIIQSNKRFTYEEVQKIIETKKGDYADEILILNSLAKKLRTKRFAEGSINFESKEVKFKLDEKTGKPLEIYIKEMKDSNRLVEEFMLLANKTVAKSINKLNLKEQPVFVYRVHDEPAPEKITDFALFVSKLGYNIKLDTRKNLSYSLNKIFKQIKGKAEENMIESLAIRTMAKAHYSTNNIGHYGLAFDYYTHFTSPIRRYPDIMVHRLLEYYILKKNKKTLDKREYEQYCIHSSERERQAIEAERASVKYKQVEYLSTQIGKEFNGHISGISKWGIYVELENNYCEGMIPLYYLEDDYYILDEENYLFYGRRTGVKYKLGDKIKIKVVKVDFSKKQIDFTLVNSNSKNNNKRKNKRKN